MEIINQIRSELARQLADAYLKIEDEYLLSGAPQAKEPESYKWQIRGMGYNDHYSAVMSFFSSHQLNVLKANGILIWQHVPIYRSKLFNTGIGISVKLKRALIYANQIGLITLI